MNRKVYLELGVLIILILGIGTFLLLHKTDTEPIIIYKGDTKPTQKIEDEDVVNKDNNSIVSDPVSGDVKFQFLALYKISY